ncbi:hypothetical protein E2C01_046802 [Portunus trituberculatus]|uniref:Uncharacterized protein n=1 Tax=Portunus trituberculatus TaxID=210409 RepID=A0A5B7FZH9_PORTR|nr:hypothetical protein [Portunus trituberculatus]
MKCKVMREKWQILGSPCHDQLSKAWMPDLNITMSCCDTPRKTPCQQDVSQQLARNSFNKELEPDLDVCTGGERGHKVFLSPQ